MQRVVKPSGQCAGIFVGVTQVWTTNVIHKEQIAGKNDKRLSLLPNEKRKTVGGMTWRLEQFHLERPYLYPVAVLCRHVLIAGRRETRDIDLCSGTDQPAHESRKQNQHADDC